MPHCVIEYSDRLDAAPILAAVFDGALQSELFEPDGADIKVRAQAYQQHISGAEHRDFIHVQLRILSGRNLEQKQHLSQSVLNQLLKLELISCSHTVEVVDIDRASYAKKVS
ncbi:5-carboxymethyl-2-hydroxymuconate Delta-isomerase [Rheinheimera aquimaris]|jgi:5-carboxymethyl-2-hydroxymuconate isomerase|uniref:5-carboxymethyl-2-hydroxymuconate Delta-isomerase n=1 Tax=Rheinheimera aquimaris TaxID=412437 RepID=UPI000E865852|nr:5-carboxymethyl-2-hydroxymuconate Delta-isomerase [Rheinheimera aquimaris]HBN89360.1 5-carboxymethyl-2-hydroxymuconate isomerase [Rheinheimera sp.]|tara:strand:+ start:14469 stop:14804 length:336 start_codon:yes stop_codon:yes gene_type:complete